MKRVAYSIFTSIALALFVGMGSLYCHVESVLLKPVIMSAITIGVLVNLMFFFIRRWDGCIEKLGGATFTLFLLLAVVMSLVSVASLLPSTYTELLGQFTTIISLQFIFVGWVATQFLRTSHFKPLKPGDSWHW